MAWNVLVHPDAEPERANLPTKERTAADHALAKLQALGPTLPHPHSSDIKIAGNLRELRPRAGNSPWRVFYRRIGDDFVVGAIGPEAQHDSKGFKRAVKTAEERLDQLEEEP